MELVQDKTKYQVRVNGEDWRNSDCANEDLLISVMEQLSITSLRADTPIGCIDIRQVGG